ncbi:MAG: 4'-phosphopantetheinyl transferase superfamily protein [Saprospirales bacterium]|nr:MAG: 4'-phosphopantetheinyl transferase superfamily protein [Saprospirales bacterium]
MPLLEKGRLNGLCSYSIWELREPADFFIDGLSSAGDLLKNCLEVSNPKRRLEMLASRYLLSTHFKGFENIEIFQNASGKPFLRGAEEFISISHNRDIVAVAVSNISVGIDVLYRDERMELLHSKFIGPEELSANETDREDAFHLIWSAKESVFKAYGKGGLDYKRDLFVKGMAWPKSEWQPAEVLMFPESVAEEFHLYYRKQGDLYTTVAASKRQIKRSGFAAGSF